MEKIVQREHLVKIRAFGLQKHSIVSYPDTYTGYIYSRFSKAQVWFDCLWGTLEYNLTKFLDMTFEGIRNSLQFLLAAIFFLFSFILIILFTVTPQYLLKGYWRLRGYSHIKFQSLIVRDHIPSNFEGSECTIKEIQKIVEKHLLLPRKSFSDLDFHDRICNIAEKRLIKVQDKLIAQDLRKLLRLIDELYVNPNVEIR